MKPPLDVLIVTAVRDEYEAVLKVEAILRELESASGTGPQGSTGEPGADAP